MTHYPCNYTKIRTTQRTTPRRSGHDQMEAHKLCTRSNATQRDRWPLCDTDRYGAESSRPTRTTSTRSPEALLRYTHASRLQRGQPRALAAAMSCEHRCDREGRKSVEVVCSTVTVRVVTGVGLSGSKAEGPGSVNVQRVVCCEPANLKNCYPRSERNRHGKRSGHREGER